MSATDELRRLLDERGVEWSDASDDDIKHTTWNNASCWFSEFGDGWTGWGMSKPGTPEQAISATLGNKRESELKDALNDVAEKWAIAQVQAEDSARRCKLLETLVCDWQELYENPDYGECLRLIDRMRKLGIEVEQ